MRVHDERLYARVFAHGSLGLGEAYMDGWWDADDLHGCSPACSRPRLDQELRHASTTLGRASQARFSTCNVASAPATIGKAHYDLGNDLFQAMLGQRLVYSCGYWDRRDNLDDAQEAKLDLVCRKLRLKPGQRVLDIGCGWGEALKFAAERYGVSGVGVTVSQEQADYARELCAGLPDRDPPAGLPRRRRTLRPRVSRSACSSTSAARTTARYFEVRAALPEGRRPARCCTASAATARPARPIRGSRNTSSPTR